MKTENLETQTQVDGSTEATSSKKPFRAGFIGLLGMPNAGKSTLVNCLVGEKITIVSDRPQTTRQRIHGIFNAPLIQAVLVDAPGVVGKTSRLNEFLNEECEDVLQKSDGILVLLNIDEESPHTLKRIIERAKEAKKPWAVVITKSDLSPAHRVQILKDFVVSEGAPYAVVSAKKDAQRTRAEVIPLLEALLPENPGPLFDVEDLTCDTTRTISSELIREACFEKLYHEIPYGLAVRLREFKENEPLVSIRADLLVEKENHKAMVVGQKAQMIKSIGIRARESLEKLLGKKVFLELHVAVRKDWTRNKTFMKELGYVIES